MSTKPVYQPTKCWAVHKPLWSAVPVPSYIMAMQGLLTDSPPSEISGLTRGPRAPKQSTTVGTHKYSSSKKQRPAASQQGPRAARTALRAPGARTLACILGWQVRRAAGLQRVPAAAHDGLGMGHLQCGAGAAQACCGTGWAPHAACA